MRPLAAAALALLIALPASAAPKKAKPKTRSLESLVKIAMTEGATADFPPEMAGELGVGKDSMTDGRLPVRLFAYKQIDCPDDQKHVFNVAYKDDESKSPLFLIFSVYRGRKEGEKVLADGYTMRVGLDGKLEKIVSVKGVVGQGDLTRIELSSKEAADIFQHEIEFFTKHSIPLKRSAR
ncbi:MAG: hypothetical protein HY079_02200 [Elusimicrobia bacterium]|nr:hypothetical protein [Elusimicrobiota bacterium]